MKKISFIIFAAVSLLASSCVTQKKLSYFHDIDKVGSDSINADYTPVKEPVIKPEDKLLINVSALDMEAVMPYNMLAVRQEEPNRTMNYSTAQVQYYTVDDQGDIVFPILGKLHLAGLTRSEARLMLEEKISAYVNDPHVNINYLNYAVVVLGEVKNPGRYSTQTEHISILDALALAGDLTIYGKRENILLTRENSNGKLEFVRINLNSADLFRSPYFYLQQNDVIYVEPNNARAIASENVSLYLSMVTTLASVSAVIVSVVSAAKK